MRPLQPQTTASIAFGLGMASQMPPSKRPDGLLCGLADELSARGVLTDLVAALGADLAGSLALAIELDRGRSRRRR